MRTPADPPRFHGAQHRGERHSAAGLPCCDALLLPRGRNSLRGFVICDGAGGKAAVARGAALGARAAWHALLDVRRQLQQKQQRQQGRPLTVPLLQARFRASYRQRRRQGPRSDHTMLACLWDRQRLLLAQVGDSTMLLRRGGVWELPLPPAKGEFANQTTFLRPHTPAHAIALWCCPAHEVDAVIAFSDGLEAAFLGAMPGDPSQLQVNGSLAELVHSEHRQRSQQPGYGDWLAQSLAAEVLAQLSDDDRTLVIASR